MLKILGRATSSNVQKVVWVCGELDIPYQREDIGGPFGGNHEPEYLALNPNATVPTIDEDGFVLWESNSISRYLSAKHGAGSLFPDDLQERARGERWMDWQLAVLGPAMFPVFWGMVRTAPEERDTDAIAAARDKLTEKFKMMDSYLADSKYLAGDSFTVGDMPVAINTFRWMNMDIPREDYANLQRWYDLMCERPPFREHVIDIGLV